MKAWDDHAACRGHDTRLFFADARAGDYQAARRFCNRCPVRAACLDEAMRFESGNAENRYGMFGGLTPDERADLARHRRRVKVPA